MFPKGLTHNSDTKIQYLAKKKKKNYVNVVLGQEQAFF